MSKKFAFFISAFFILSMLVIVALVRADYSKGNLAENAALGLKDTTTVAWVNDREIPRGTLVGAANTYITTEGVSAQEAYQKALNLIVQNSLFLQAAINRCLLSTDAEVEARGQEFLTAAGKDEQLREIYSAQASAMGMEWDSPEFKAYLFNQHKQAFPVEKLNQQIRAQAGDDDAEYNRLKVEIISEMYSTADIRIDFEALPDAAKDIHIPQLSEFPMIIAGDSEFKLTP